MFSCICSSISLVKKWVSPLGITDKSLMGTNNTKLDKTRREPQKKIKQNKKKKEKAEGCNRAQHTVECHNQIICTTQAVWTKCVVLVGWLLNVPATC